MDVADLFKYLTGYHRQVPLWNYEHYACSVSKLCWSARGCYWKLEYERMCSPCCLVTVSHQAEKGDPAGGISQVASRSRNDAKWVHLVDRKVLTIYQMAVICICRAEQFKKSSRASAVLSPLTALGYCNDQRLCLFLLNAQKWSLSGLHGMDLWQGDYQCSSGKACKYHREM
jgi:hypothetical protein